MSCCCTSKKTLILSCSGGSNVGQISNNCMIELDRNGVGNAFCLAGLGGDLTGFIESCRAGKTIVIDGCPVACAQKTFERHSLVPDTYIVITELGIEKNHDFSKLDDETKIAYSKLKDKIPAGGE